MLKIFIGLRYIAKLLLNSLWGKIVYTVFTNIFKLGKFAQKNDNVEHKNFNSHDINSWISFLNNEKIIISQIIPISQEFIHVTYKPRREYIKENRNSNLVVAVKNC